MEQIPGLGETSLLKKLERQTVAERTVIAHTRDGVEKIKVEDNAARGRALDMAFTLGGKYPAKQVEISGRVRVEQLQMVAHAYAHLTVPELKALLAAEEEGEDPA